MNDLRLALAAVGLGCLAMPAHVAPVFLTCHMTQPSGEVFQADVQLNEEASTVTYSFPDNGRTFTVRGFFTPNEVTFGAFSISRADLTFSRVNNDAFSRMRGDPSRSAGKCVADKNPKAF